MPNPDRLMTLSEVANYLQLKERTLYQWAQQGWVPGFKLGNLWRFQREDIDRWIEAQKRKTQPSNVPSAHTLLSDHG